MGMKEDAEKIAARAQTELKAPRALMIPVGARMILEDMTAFMVKVGEMLDKKGADNE